MPGAIFLEGDNVELRTVEEEDLEFIRDAYNHPEVREYMSHSRPFNLDQEREFFEEVVKSEESVNLAICLDGETIGLVEIKEEEEGVGEIGIWIGPEHQGEGYGSEASELLADYAFNELPYHKLVARAWQDNEASQGIWEKLGFEQEGKLREQVFNDGRYGDVYIYGLLRDEWEE